MANINRNQSSRLPRNNPLVKHDVEAILIGILFVLVGTLGFTNSTIVSALLTLATTFLLGKLDFIVYLYIIVLGFYRILWRRPLRIYLSFSSIGAVIILLSAQGLFTHYTIIAEALDAVSFNNFIPLFLDSLPSFGQLPTSYNAAVGGGIVGYFLSATANAIAASSGYILLFMFLTCGLLFIATPMWVFMFRYLKKRQEEKKLEAAHFMKARGLAEASIETKVILEEPVLPDKKPRPTMTFIPKTTTRNTYSRPLNNDMPNSGLRKVSYHRGSKSQQAIEAPDHDSEQTFTSKTTNPVLRKLEPDMHPLVSELHVGDSKIQPRVSHQEVKGNIEQPAPEQPISTSINTQSYQYPNIELLDDVPEETDTEYNEEIAIRRMAIINQTFLDLGVKAQAVSFQVGPSFTSFDIQLDRGTLVKTVATVINEISIRLGGMPALFTEVVPGKTTSTLEVPNEKISIVSFKEIIKDIDRKPEFQQRVVLPFGKNILGELELLPLKDIIHMLVAGTTGSGKSVFMHTLIMTILMRSHPDDIKLIIIDPKRVEMLRYDGLPHLMAPIINDYSQAKVAVTRLLEEMQRRYDLFQNVGISSIDAYNRYARDKGLQPLPLIAMIIDEYADLVEGIPSISDIVERLAAMARASGIHLVIATQRPITKIVSGNIKNNIITKVALQMSAQVDSVTVLGHAGAEKLLGNGDMIVSCPKLSRYGELRLQGAFVSEEDTIRVTSFIKDRCEPDYHPNFVNLVDVTSMGPAFPGVSIEEPLDERYEDIKLFTMRHEYMSSSRLMREFNMGFNRTLRIIKQLQTDGVLAIGPANPQSNKGIPVLVRTGDDEQNNNQ